MKSYGDTLRSSETIWSKGGVAILTFMFHRIPGRPQTVHRQMEKETERVYAIFVTRVVRKPTSPSAQGFLPIWILFPDFPVPKHAKKPLRDVALNDGRHIQGIALMPPVSRMSEGLDN